MSDDWADETLQPARSLVDRVPSMLAYFDARLTCRFAGVAGGERLRPGSHGARILQSSPVPVMVISSRTDHP